MSDCDDMSEAKCLGDWTIGLTNVSEIGGTINLVEESMKTFRWFSLLGVIIR